MNNSNIKQFLDCITQGLENSELIKIVISKIRNKNVEVKNVSIKPVIVNKNHKLSFVYKYPTKDITKNFDYVESIVLIKEMIEKSYLQADLFTTNNNMHLSINKKNNSSIAIKPVSNVNKPLFNHDNIKTRIISSENNVYLQQLGVVNVDGTIKKDMNDKFKQINKYVEIIDSVLKDEKISESVSIADMGSGKGYLTFALYDYLYNNLHLKPNILGIEYRKELVDKCNAIAQNAKFENLKFKEGTIEKAEINNVDMLIALHACDTATDEAIYKGITENSKIIICAPCCHKQIRKQLIPNNELKEIIKYGILAERQAEIITDTIRALILEAYGYKTKVFEFISTEHTPKNVLIVATKKTGNSEIDSDKLNQIKSIKTLFGIKYHYLEKLLKID